MEPTEFWCWEHSDAIGKRRKTTWKLSRAQAERTLKDAVPITSTREVRNLPESNEEWHMTGAFRNTKSE